MTQKVLGTNLPKAYVYFGNRSAIQKQILAAQHTGSQDSPNPSLTGLPKVLAKGYRYNTSKG